MEQEIKTTNSIETSHSLETTHAIDLSDKLYKVMMSIIVIGVVFLVAQLIHQFKSLPQNMPHEITVSGEGKEYIKPDIALVSFGVNTQELKSQDAVNKNNEKMNEIIKAIKELGIDDKDIQTTLYNLTPVYEYTVISSRPTDSGLPMMYSAPIKNNRVFSGYSLDQQISVKIRNFDNINAVLDKASVADATTIGELQFTVDNPEMARSKARAKAIENAKVKLYDIAKQSGLKVGKLVNVYEGYNNYPQPMYGIGSSVMEKSLDNVPQIQTGQLEVNSSVTLTYQVR